MKKRLYNDVIFIKRAENAWNELLFVEKSPKKETEIIAMKITDVRVRKVTAAGKMKAVVSVTFDDSFVVHDIKVIEGKERMFIAMPSRKTSEGEFKDVAHPINTALRDELQTIILEKYEEALKEEPVEETAE